MLRHEWPCALMMPHSPPVGRVLFARHFMLLGSTAALLIAAGPRVTPRPTVVAFGLYGALHAVMLAASLRNRPTPVRALLFVALAASFSMLSAWLILWGSHSVPALAGSTGLGALVGLASVLGALSYSLLIRRCWMRDLPLRAVAAIALGCLLATLLALQVRVPLWSNGRLWFAVFWWFAVSAGFWIQDFRLAAACRAVRG